MKKYFCLLIMPFLILLGGCNFNISNFDFKKEEVVLDNGVIIFNSDIPAENIALKKQRFTPSKKEAALGLEILRKYLINNSEIQNSNNYIIQIVGYTGDNGEKNLWLNALCKKENNNKLENLSQNVMLIEDGGFCYFQAWVDIANKEVTNFLVNGEA